MDRTRLLFDVGRAQNPIEDEESSATRDQRRALRGVTAQRGIRALRLEEDQRFRACNSAPASRAACEALAGTTVVTLRYLRFVSEDEATLDAAKQWFDASGAATNMVWELRLRRVEGAWRVADTRIRLHG